ncbi:MAG: N-formylglutamate amidohydrolase [Hyphomicrobiales bacterium]|nr:N-formylglutamate amidohydrolase [Hyphomicrobiales bacterium]
MNCNNNTNQSYYDIEGDLSKGFILLCDHARNNLPEKYGSLGLSRAQFERHIAYDIGAEALTIGLAKRLGVPAIMTKFSRLLIDPNRGLDDPTLIMKLSDGTVIDGNHPIEESEVEHRKRNFYQPYHDAVSTLIEKSLGRGVVPMIFSIHSFTDSWKGEARHWHAGILWDQDERLPNKLLEQMAKQTDIIVGNNEPYDGALSNDTLYTHCTKRGLAHALLEVRQDLICHIGGINEWVDRLVKVIEPVIGLPDLHKVMHRGSRTGHVDYIQNGIDC